MKTFKLYGTKYPMNSTTGRPADAFGYKNEILDDPPDKGKLVGYVTMEDGSIIECWQKFNVLFIILPLLIILCGLAGFVYWLFFIQKKDVKFMGDIVEVSHDTNVVTYSGFPSARNGELRIQFQNGEVPAKIIVSGDGISTTVTDVEAGAFVDSIPVTVDSSEALIEAQISVKTASSEQSFPIVVEVPENLNGNDSLEGMEGFWFGEQIIFIEPTPATE